MKKVRRFEFFTCRKERVRTTYNSSLSSDYFGEHIHNICVYGGGKKPQCLSSTNSNEKKQGWEGGNVIYCHTNYCVRI